MRSRRLLSHTIVHDGISRTAYLYVPRHLKANARLPLVLVFHGGGSDPQAIARTSGLHLLAEREGFIVAYPAGMPGAKGLSWSPTVPGGPAHNADIRFIRHLIVDLQVRYDTDPERVFAVGFSIGGALVYELACRLSNRIAGIAVVSGAMLMDECSPMRPVPVIHIHGTKDRRVPLKGGRGPSTAEHNVWPPVRDGIDKWRNVNGCAEAPKTIRQGLQGVTGHRYVGAADVELWIVEGGYHAWPGGRRSDKEESAAPRTKFSASETIWAFFVAQARKRRAAQAKSETARSQLSSAGADVDTAGRSMRIR